MSATRPADVEQLGQTLLVGGTAYGIAGLRVALEGIGGPGAVPASICILIEMLMRANGFALPEAARAALASWPQPGPAGHSVQPGPRAAAGIIPARRC